MWPLPIGKEALERRWSHTVRAADYVVLSSYLPFDGTEEAIWALRIEEGGNSLDLFGLADYQYNDEFEQREMRVGIGDLKFILRGQNTALLDYRDHADRWWTSWRKRGHLPLGRPRSSGIWQRRELFEADLDRTVAEMKRLGEKVTQEKLAERLGIHKKTLMRKLDECGRSWQDVIKD